MWGSREEEISEEIKPLLCKVERTISRQMLVPSDFVGGDLYFASSRV